jgi:hypothetical protein
MPFLRSLTFDMQPCEIPVEYIENYFTNLSTLRFWFGDNPRYVKVYMIIREYMDSIEIHSSSLSFHPIFVLSIMILYFFLFFMIDIF